MSKYPPVKVGNRYGRLTVLSSDADKVWLCQCDCGDTKSIQGYSLASGGTRSCGCLRREKTAITGANQKIKNPYTTDVKYFFSAK